MEFNGSFSGFIYKLVFIDQYTILALHAGFYVIAPAATFVRDK